MNSSSSPENPPNPPPRGEIFDIALDENGQIIGDSNPAPRKAGAWFFVGLAALFCAYNIGAYVGQKSKVPAPVGPFTAPAEKLRPIRVQIAGRVKKPGVYSLPGGARLEDALKKAEGVLPGADLSALNLADWAVDGSKIEIPIRRKTPLPVAPLAPTPTPLAVARELLVTPPQNLPGEAMPAANLEILARQNAPKTSTPDSDKTRSTSKSGGKSAPAALALLRKNPVDLNRASAEQLSVLPGVGPKMAERIVAYRRENGAFKSLADLDNVKGIGEKRLEMLRSLVKVN